MKKNRNGFNDELNEEQLNNSTEEQGRGTDENRGQQEDELEDEETGELEEGEEEEGEYEEGEEEEEEEGDDDLEGEVRQAKKKVKGYSQQVEAIAKEVIAYVKENAQNMDLDMKTVAKYAAVAALGIYGIRKGGFLGSILVSAAASIAAKHLLGDEAAEEIRPKMRKAATA